MHYHSIEKEDIPYIRTFFQGDCPRLCDYTLGNLLMWKEAYYVHVAREEDVLSFRMELSDGGRIYSLPLGNTEKGLRRILEDETGNVAFNIIPAEALPLFELPGCRTEVTEDPEIYDYIYRSEDLRELKGRKYAGQRNHIHKFEKAVSAWTLEDITPDNLPEILDFFDRVYDPGPDMQEDAAEENALVRTVVQDPAAFGMFGSTLRADGRIAGFSLAEKVGDTMTVHIEKADRNFPGAYQMLVNQFVRKHADETIRFINREDDTGDPGLRAAKLAYHPCELLRKYDVTLYR